jgi:hypothetical protein
VQGPIKGDSPVVDNSRKYGDLPPLPGASNPRERANSFDADDEKRNFSNSTVRQPSPSAAEPSSAGGPATRFSQITGVPTVRNTSGPPLHISTQSVTQPTTGLRKASQVVSPISGSPHPDILQPGRGGIGEGSPAGPSPLISPSSDTRTPSSDYQARRDFSPSAVPPPLTTRASPTPQSATDSPSTKFPARKSSLSQTGVPDLSVITGLPQAQAAPKPWTAARSASPGAAGRSPATPTGKALPFIRPADIYRRVEEEKEKERQSLDSGRPSMDSITGAKSSERSDSPAKSHLREKSSSDSLGGRRSRTSLEGDDASESGRLRPMLEPVRERKSEYGFEGFNVNDQTLQQESESRSQKTASFEHDHLDVEETRRHSTSPKLPDLNRISGFGMDMFSQSKPEDTFLSTIRDAEATPTGPTTVHIPSSNTDDFTLRNQPSFGFRSVVKQAFDRTDDSSVPNTPASQANSGIRRTDSESTGTDGISPIMSRVPSAAVRDRNRDVSNPTILEVVNEPVSPEQGGQEGQKELHLENVQGPPSEFKPGYNREINTPSRENSPARHPDVAKTKIVPSGQQAVVSETSPDAHDEPLQPPRPIADREQSFRPALPGGWTSYTTSANSEAPTQQSVERTQTPVSEVSLVQESRDEGDYDITPTTTRHPLPESAFDAAVAGAALGGAAGPALGRRDKPSPSGTPVSGKPRVVPSSNALPTSDPSMVPSVNLYSTMNLDPRLLPKLEQAPPETQLRLDAVNRAVPAEFSVAPTPPPKDTPVREFTGSDSEYLPKPTVPLKQRTPDGVGTETLEQPWRPDILPTLSTDTGPYDEENDKLRKEIVKSLSPRPSDAGQHHESMLANEIDDGPSATQGRESTYLPTEYDNYWASTAEDEDPVPVVSDLGSKHEALPQQSEVVSPVATESPLEREIDSPLIPPLSPRRLEPASQGPERPSLSNRFSWQEGSEHVSVGEPNMSAGNTDVVSRDVVEEPRKATIEAKNMAEPVTSTAETALFQFSPLSSGRSLEGADTTPAQDISSDHVARDAALLAGGAAVVGAAVTAHGPQSPGSNQRRLSLAEEKDPRVGSYPVSPTPPEDEHPANSPTPYFSLSATQLSHAPPSTVSPVAAPVKPQLSPIAGKLLAFREIVAIQSTQQRIQTFDETRHRWADMDSGLTDWIAKLQSQYPEHANASGSWAGSRTSAPIGSSRSKFAKASGGSAPPLQEPYYRQYLNASPTTPSTPTRPGPGPGPSLQSGSQQSFSPAGNKPTSHQVQSKGKELLHSAGIFGGKAGKAGKGLLAKGKNKLRGAGGGDKVD